MGLAHPLGRRRCGAGCWQASALRPGPVLMRSQATHLGFLSAVGFRNRGAEKLSTAAGYCIEVKPPLLFVLQE